jgi:hypothetical protein
MINIDLIHQLLDRYNSTPTECDGLTRICSTVLNKHNISHQPMAGTLTFEEYTIPIHLWINLPTGFTIDYRARMWLVHDETIPHGIFKPSDYPNVIYEGKPIELEPLSHVVFDVLCLDISDFLKDVEF